jgi:putative thioredoxin
MDVTGDSFQSLVLDRSHEVPVVVDFWAEWCGPCRMLTPVLEQAVEARNGQVELAKVDVDAEQELAQRFTVSGIPAVKAFRRGGVVAEFVGAKPRQAVEAFLDGLTEPSEGERLLAELRERGSRPDLIAAVDSEDWETAFELLLSELESADGDAREEVRRIMVALFGELGQEHPLAVRYRRRLATALY